MTSFAGEGADLELVEMKMLVESLQMQWNCSSRATHVFVLNRIHHDRPVQKNVSMKISCRSVHPRLAIESHSRQLGHLPRLDRRVTTTKSRHIERAITDLRDADKVLTKLTMPLFGRADKLPTGPIRTRNALNTFRLPGNFSQEAELCTHDVQFIPLASDRDHSRDNRRLMLGSV